VVQEFEYELDLWGTEALVRRARHGLVISSTLGGWGTDFGGRVLVLYAGEPGRLRNAPGLYSHGLLVDRLEKGGVPSKGEWMFTGSFLLSHSTTRRRRYEDTSN